MKDALVEMMEDRGVPLTRSAYIQFFFGRDGDWKSAYDGHEFDCGEPFFPRELEDDIPDEEYPGGYHQP